MKLNFKVIASMLLLFLFSCGVSKNNHNEETTEVKKDSTTQVTDSADYSKALERSINEKLLPVYKEQLKEKRKEKSNEK